MLCSRRAFPTLQISFNMPRIKATEKLFDNSDSEEDDGFTTNKAYAKHYDEFRKKEILSHRKLNREIFQNF